MGSRWHRDWYTKWVLRLSTGVVARDLSQADSATLRWENEKIKVDDMTHEETFRGDRLEGPRHSPEESISSN